MLQFVTNMNASIFQFVDYKRYIKSQIESADSNWGLISKLADAAGCQRSYLSRVLSSEVHLVADHIYGLSEHWRLSESETDYFLLLLEKEKASTPKYRNRINTNIVKAREAHENLQNKTKKPSADLSEKEIKYYSAWYWSAIHIATSIPELQSLGAISKKLHLNEDLVLEVLNELTSYGWIKKEGSGVKEKWKFNSSELHVPKSSHLSTLHHSNWRHLAVLDSQRTKSNSGFHFTAVQSIDQKAWEQLKELILKFIEDAQKISSPAKEEKLISFCLDFFEVD
jgi:uncharacterized protein (TIGR02147 family)